MSKCVENCGTLANRAARDPKHVTAAHRRFHAVLRLDASESLPDIAEIPMKTDGAPERRRPPRTLPSAPRDPRVLPPPPRSADPGSAIVASMPQRPPLRSSSTRGASVHHAMRNGIAHRAPVVQCGPRAERLKNHREKASKGSVKAPRRPEKSSRGIRITCEGGRWWVCGIDPRNSPADGRNGRSGTFGGGRGTCRSAGHSMCASPRYGPSYPQREACRRSVGGE
jgi:hypothetical protein